jgi:ABC-type multidrug transport system fused ATPase/permease subunit
LFKSVGASFSLLTKDQKSKYLLLVIARGIVQLADLVGLAAVGFLAAAIASGLNATGTASFMGFSVSLGESRQFLLLVIAVVVFFVLKSAIASWLLRLVSKFLAAVEAKSSIRVARSLFAGGLERLSTYSSGELLWVVTTSSHIAFSVMLFAGATVATEAFLFVSVLATFLLVDFSTALIVAGYFLLVVAIFQLAVSRRLKRIGERLSHNLVEGTNRLMNISAAFREISVADKIDAFIEKFSFARSQYASDLMLQRFVMGLPRFFVEAALMVGFLGIVIWQFVQGSLTDGLVTTGVFLTGGVRMMASLLPLQNAISEIRMRGPEALRAQEILIDFSVESNANHVKQPRADFSVSESAAAYSVRVEDLSYTFPGEKSPVLNSISIDIKAGQFAALVGPSGAGKTTFADIVLGLRTPTSGRILLSGAERGKGTQSLAGAVGYVPQRPGIISGTIAENIALSPGGQEIDPDRVRLALDQAGLSDHVDSLPNGIHTNLGPQLDSLSGGQIQRLGLARALYSRPRLLVLDEATSGLDAETEAGIAATVAKLSGDTTLLVIAHRLSTIQNADSVIVIDQGEVKAQGSFREVRSRVPLVERYVQLMKIED